MNLQTAEQLQNLIGVRGYVMTFWKGKAVMVQWCTADFSGVLHFRGLDRFRNVVDIHVPLAEITTPQFVITSKARVGWTW